MCKYHRLVGTAAALFIAGGAVFLISLAVPSTSHVRAQEESDATCVFNGTNDFGSPDINVSVEASCRDCGGSPGDYALGWGDGDGTGVVIMGSSGGGGQYSHTYSQSGTYTVDLICNMDNLGRGPSVFYSSRPFDIYINSPPPPDDSGGGTPPPACGNGIDDDNDGLVDYPADPGCGSGGSDDEYNAPLPACRDGLDNDNDGLVDYPDDPGCTSPSDDNEYNVNHPAPTADLRCNGAESCEIASGDSVTLSWSSDHATACYGSDGWSGEKPTSGSEVVANITDSTLFTLTCNGDYGQGYDATTASVQGGKTHTVCDQNACTVVDGSGANACGSDLDCGGGGTHSVCGNRACIWVPGSGTNECGADSDCGGNAHFGCVVFGASRVCASLPGPGANSCSSDAQCSEGWHAECRSSSCTVVQGEGINRCTEESVCEGDKCSGEGCDTGNGYCTFTASKTKLVIPPPKSTVLSWNCTGVKNCSISGGIGAVGTTGSREVSPGASTTYTLSCTVKGTGATVTADKRIHVYDFGGGALEETPPWVLPW